MIADDSPEVTHADVADLAAPLNLNIWPYWANQSAYATGVRLLRKPEMMPCWAIGASNKFDQEVNP